MASATEYTVVSPSSFITYLAASARTSCSRVCPSLHKAVSAPLSLHRYATTITLNPNNQVIKEYNAAESSRKQNKLSDNDAALPWETFVNAGKRFIRTAGDRGQVQTGRQKATSCRYHGASTHNTHTCAALKRDMEKLGRSAADFSGRRKETGWFFFIDLGSCRKFWSLTGDEMKPREAQGRRLVRRNN